jgi:predicted lipoprotein with Yx(FWY)xxD motif
MTQLVKLQNSATLGTYLVDKDGRTLYYFANDSVTVNTCTGNCANIWPAFYADNLGAGSLGAGLNQADFSKLTTTTGANQLAYKGRPLYYYAPLTGSSYVPEPPGSTLGEGVNGIWFVAKPDYTIMLTRAQLVGANGKNYVFTNGTPTPVYSEGTGKSIYFTDGMGVTLYIFKPDKFNTNTYTDAAFTKNPIWPIYEMDKIVVPSILDKSQFGVITVFGHKQMTYKGWPLYYFGQDQMMMGSNQGISFPQPGIWPVAEKDLSTAPNP